MPPVLVRKTQHSVRSDVVNAGKECLAGGCVLVAVQAEASVERIVIFAYDGVLVAFHDPLVIGIKGFGKLIRHSFYWRIESGDVEERYGIGRVAAEYLLIDVQPDAENATCDFLSRHGSLDERAANLAVEPIDVVRPLQLYGSAIVVEHGFHGECTSH